MSGAHIRFRDSDDEYQPSNSEDELSDSEKQLLKKARNKGAKYSDSEEEVYGVNSDDSDQSDIALSDVEGQGEDDDDGMPDPKAWGKNKRNYYATDYVDPDYGGFQGKDASLAQLEEEEARTLQTALAKYMDDDDFALDLIPTKEKKETVATEKSGEEVIKTDVSQLSKRQKLHLLEKESPEFFGLIKDYEEKMTCLRDVINPIIQLHKENTVESCEAMDFLLSYNELILNYCTNIYMYLLLKANRAKVQSHPVIKRLFQFRRLLKDSEDIFKSVVEPQLKYLNQDEDEESKPQPMKKTLKLLSKLKAENVQQQNEDSDEELPKKKSSLKTTNEAASNKTVKFAANNCGLAENSDTSSNEEGEPDEKNEAGEGEIGKRKITYQIAKNKGLTPHRKKEQRNPRVKHRNKFRKAKIRRKGAVREVRTEMSRYGGESSGIKASVTKSIKIKS